VGFIVDPDCIFVIKGIFIREAFVEIRIGIFVTEIDQEF
jgi:hypothetical protein